MKTYTIKYETYSGKVMTVDVQAYDQQHVINRLYNCKEVLSCTVKEETAYEQV